uniref:Uncharacterized protein n=1 Tax=Meloidogyne enterolobii TaxID=390850 RepID=A0A6V7WAS0_MELEN|nr:unnamed protein product [Meloidogyne enterolobii]
MSQPNSRNNSINDECTPLLSACSLPSMLNEPLTNERHEGEDEEVGRENSPFMPENEERNILSFQASTSQSVEQLNRSPRRRNRHSNKRNRRRRRIYSDTDLSKMRPLILSPFMPNFATQISVDAQNRRLTNTSLTGIRTISTAPQQPTSATIVPTNIFFTKKWS